MLRSNQTIFQYLRESYPRRILRWTLIIIVLLIFAFITSFFFLGDRYSSYSLNSHDTDYILQKLCNSNHNSNCDNNDGNNSLMPQLEHAMVNHLFEDNQMHDLHSSANSETWIDGSIWSQLPVKGVLYMFLSNEDLQAARSTMRSVEDRFNHKVGYPWVILSNQYLNPTFRKYISKVTNARVFFGRVDRETWEYPDWIPTSQAEIALRMLETKVPGGVSPSFHFSSRYHSGFYFHHPLLQNADYSWRVEPGSHYSCDIEDPFLKLKNHNRTLGFVMTSHEENTTASNLWPITSQFIEQFPDYIQSQNDTIMSWLFDDSEFNYCHIWSSFLVVDLSFLRSKEYQTYFTFLDYSGGFFYENWSDGAIITLAASMFLKREQLQFFNEVGYEYRLGVHCPLSLRDYYPQCSCDVELNSDFNKDSCTISMLQHVDQDVIKDIVQFSKSYLMTDSQTESLLSRLQIHI